VSYLLDVNTLVAWGWADHADHDRAAAWVATTRKRRGVTLLTSAIPQLGFVRVSVQRSGGRIEVSEAAETLSGMLAALGKSHAFLSDDLASTTAWPHWCAGSRQTTDAHLLHLARKHGAELATLDATIPGAFLIPVTVS
jgi:predicted nucleic acid-binding protein